MLRDCPQTWFTLHNWDFSPPTSVSPSPTLQPAGSTSPRSAFLSPAFGRSARTAVGQDLSYCTEHVPQVRPCCCEWQDSLLFLKAGQYFTYVNIYMFYIYRKHLYMNTYVYIAIIKKAKG